MTVRQGQYLLLQHSLGQVSVLQHIYSLFICGGGLEVFIATAVAWLMWCCCDVPAGCAADPIIRFKNQMMGPAVAHACAVAGVARSRDAVIDVCGALVAA